MSVQNEAHVPVTVGQAIRAAQETAKRARGVAQSDGAVEALAETVAELAECVEGIACMVGEVLVNEATLRRQLDLLLGGVKRLPAWAMRQGDEVQRWLAQLPQEVLDSEHLEAAYRALAIGGMNANAESLEYLRQRVADQEPVTASEQGAAA